MEVGGSPASGPIGDGALTGLRVLDIGTVLAAPVAATILGEFGAEVIKVELPGIGDTLRQLGPVDQGVPLWWAIEGRNKKSITLDVRQPEGQDIFRRLVAHADVVIENFSPGTMEGWGLGYEALAAVNPRLVMVRVSGFGQHGPYHHLPGYDRVGLAMGGLTYVTGFPDRPPARPGLAICDYGSAVFAALGALIALFYRDGRGTGRGQVVDLALYESVLRFFHYHLAAYDRLSAIAERTGNANPGQVPGDNFQTADGKWVTIGAGNNNMFHRLGRAIGRPELADDPRFRTNRLRTANAAIVHGIIGEWVATHSLAEVMTTLEAARVAVGPVYTAADIHADAHFRQRRSVIEVEDAALGSIAMQGVVPKLSLTPGTVKTTGPALGQHNEEIYCGLLGLSHEELGVLIGKGIV